MIERRADARWEGDLREGRGTMRLGSGAFEGKYSFGTRFEGAPGTNPEELIGAAHAGCYSMALANALAKAGHKPRSIETSAVVHLDKVEAGFGITTIDLSTRGQVPGIAEAEFQRFAEDAKKNCIVSRALAGVTIRLTATLTAG
jgi:lipoyl-dependent peroxiredoxin